MTTIGLEEEFMLLDPRTLAPVGRAAEVIEAVRMTVHAPFVTSEFYASQLEYASPILSTSEDASRALGSFRVALAEIAARLGVVAAGVGLPFDVTDDARLTPGARYLDIADHFGAIVADHQLNGLHVHVGVPDREAAIRASNRLRPGCPRSSPSRATPRSGTAGTPASRVGVASTSGAGPPAASPRTSATRTTTTLVPLACWGSAALPTSAR